jgi:hypothetical protein
MGYAGDSMGAEREAEMRELITEAWRMVVPKRLAAAHLTGRPALSPLPTGLDLKPG